MNAVKIIVVDDSATFREGLRFFIENMLFCTVIAEASNGHEFLQLKNKHLADIILMDIQMPTLNGIEAVLNDDNNYLRKFIAISSFEDKVYLTQLLETGFKGYISKNNIYKELKKAIELVAAGCLYFPDNIKVEK